MVREIGFPRARDPKALHRLKQGSLVGNHDHRLEAAFQQAADTFQHGRMPIRQQHGSLFHVP
jgi:hypothetical protein